MNNKIEQKEKLEHNFLQDAMDDGQKHNDQVFAHNLCETCSGQKNKDTFHHIHNCTGKYPHAIMKQ